LCGEIFLSISVQAVISFHISEEILLSFIFPEASRELKAVIQETAAVLIASNTYSLFSAYGGQFLYFEGNPSADKSAGVRLCGICLLSAAFHPPMLSAFAQALCQIYADAGAPPRPARVPRAADGRHRGAQGRGEHGGRL
jgi:hypothetical protein